MIKFLNDLDPLVLDVAVGAILVLIIFFGAIRGVKKTVINIFASAVSLFLGFSSYTASIKNIIIEKLFFVEYVLPAGSDSFEIFLCYLLGSLFASLVLFTFIYIFLQSVLFVVRMIIKRKKVRRANKKTVLGRFLGATISLLYGGAILVVLLFVMGSNIMGLGDVINRSTVTKFLVVKSDELLSKVKVDMKEQLVFKVYKGDFMAETSDKVINAYKYIDDIAVSRFAEGEYIYGVENVAFTKEETEKKITEYVLDLYYISVISNELDDNNILLKQKYVNMANDFIAIMNKTVHLNSLGDLGFSIQEEGNMRSTLADAGVNDAGVDLFGDILQGVTN